MGLASIKLENFIKAEKYFELLIPLKKSHELYYIFGNIQKKLKKYKSAITSFENAIELKPKIELKMERTQLKMKGLS